MSDWGLEIELCEAQSEKHPDDTEPCLAEKGHDGPHIFWIKSPWEEENPQGTWGMHFFDGDTDEAIYNVEYAGEPSIEEAAAVYALFEEYKKRRGN